MLDRNHTIEKLSKRTGVNVETIRYYERIGLLPQPPRSTGGHRLYSDDHLKRLGFIRHGLELGFTLDEVRNLIGLVDGDYLATLAARWRKPRCGICPTARLPI